MEKWVELQANVENRRPEPSYDRPNIEL